MKTVSFEKRGDPHVLQDKEMPLPMPSRHEVRIKVKAVGLNPADCKIRSGIFGETSFPHILGAECSGVIDAVGDPHHEFAEGDEVYAFCYFQGSNGSYAESLTVPTQFVAKKPKNLSFEEAAGIPVTYLTAYQAMMGCGAFQQDRPLFIAGGSGGVGSAAIALSKCYQGGPVFTTAGSDQAHDYLVSYFQIPSKQILRYQGLTLDQMAEKLGKFYFALDCVGKEMKKLCFAVCDFNGHISSVVPEEIDIPIWGRGSSLVQYSQSLHLVYLPAQATQGTGKDWMVYKMRLEELTKQFEAGNLQKPKIEVIGNLEAATVQEGHHRLEEGHTIGKLIISLDSTT